MSEINYDSIFSKYPDYSLKDLYLKPYYRDLPEWNDVTPLPQGDEDLAVVCIDYSPRFKDVYSYFRAVLTSEEVSERVFTLNTDAFLLNPANYTVTQHRRNLIKALKKSIPDELTFCANIIHQESKNYQLWYHRQTLAELGNEEGSCDYCGELNFTKEIIANEPRHYHAWQYRQHLLSHSKCHWDDEFAYTHDLIEEDVLNNSAWNHRYFVFDSTQRLTDSEALLDEIKFVKSAICRHVDNESTWNYLKGILFNFSSMMQHAEELYDFAFIRLYRNEGLRFAQLLAFLVDFYSECIECYSQKPQNIPLSKSELLSSIQELCLQLQKNDVIRCKYWNWCSQNLTSKFETLLSKDIP